LDDAGAHRDAAAWRRLAAAPSGAERPDMLGHAYEVLGLYQLAETEYRRLAVVSDDPIIAFDLGQLELERGFPEDGVAALRRAIQAIPNQEDFRLALARLYMQAGRPNEAVMEYRVVLDLDPGSVEAQAAIKAPVAVGGAPAW